VHPGITLEELVLLEIVHPLHEVAGGLLWVGLYQGLDGVWNLRVAHAAANVVKYVFDMLQACRLD